MRGQKTMRRHRRWASTSHGEMPQEKPPANVDLAGKLYGKKNGHLRKGVAPGSRGLFLTLACASAANRAQL